MSTLQLLERHLSPFDILFKNHFNAGESFAPALNSKQPHPLNIFHDDKGLFFEVACTGLSKKSFDLRYKIAPKFDLSQTDASLTNGLLEIFIPLAEEAKPKSIKIK